MGVSGAGKSTVAEQLAARLGCPPLEESDTLHPEANVAMMHAGVPLTDADRRPWLEAVADWVDRQRATKQGRPVEPRDPDIVAFYGSLLAALRRGKAFREGSWSLIAAQSAWAGNPTSGDFVAYLACARRQQLCRRGELFGSSGTMLSATTLSGARGHTLSTDRRDGERGL
jgi:hypothetical protein